MTFLKPSISLKCVELDATNLQVQKLCIISKNKLRMVILENSPSYIVEKKSNQNFAVHYII